MSDLLMVLVYAVRISAILAAMASANWVVFDGTRTGLTSLNL